MNILFWTLFLLAAFTPKGSIYHRDVTNFVGFGIGTMGLTYNGGFPAMFQRTGNTMPLVMTGAFAYVVYFCAKDEIKVINHRKRGRYLVSINRYSESIDEAFQEWQRIDESKKE